MSASRFDSAMTRQLLKKKIKKCVSPSLSLANCVVGTTLLIMKNSKTTRTGGQNEFIL